MMTLLTLPILTCMEDAICLTLRPESRRERIEVILEESGFMMVRKQVEQLFGHVWNQTRSCDNVYCSHD